jgi:hypothetical protein
VFAPRPVIMIAGAVIMIRDSGMSISDSGG